MSNPTGEQETIQQLLELNRQLLVSIIEGDWKTYATLCDHTITAFEPESRGQLAEGMPFHQFYFDRGGISGPYNITISNPHVRLMGDVAVVCYIRLVQRLDSTGNPITVRGEETRIWQRKDGAWRHVHFHRSASV